MLDFIGDLFVWVFVVVFDELGFLVKDVDGFGVVFFMLVLDYVIDFVWWFGLSLCWSMDDCYGGVSVINML